MTYNAKYSSYLDYFNNTLSQAFNELDSDAPSLIKDAMRYAVLGGGKRIRPILCYATTEMLGLNIEEAKYFALAIEFIHAYSLVHDDLPAMDNDDYRRGKLSTHKKFGEAFGILAGDSLLTFAFETALKKPNFSLGDLEALKILAEYSGYNGMICGQVLDLQNEKSSNPDEKTLYSIYINKTSKLLTAPMLMASKMAGGKYFDELREFGFHLGMTFQIVDDTLDQDGTLESIGKTPNKDLAEDKLTSIKVFGYEGAKQKAKYHFDCCMKIMAKIPNSQFLLELCHNLVSRKK